jgi:hypothetical protein
MSSIYTRENVTIALREHFEVKRAQRRKKVREYESNNPLLPCIDERYPHPSLLYTEDIILGDNALANGTRTIGNLWQKFRGQSIEGVDTKKLKELPIQNLLVNFSFQESLATPEELGLLTRATIADSINAVWNYKQELVTYEHGVIKQGKLAPYKKSGRTLNNLLRRGSVFDVPDYTTLNTFKWEHRYMPPTGHKNTPKKRPRYPNVFNSVAWTCMYKKETFDLKGPIKHGALKGQKWSEAREHLLDVPLEIFIAYIRGRIESGNYRCPSRQEMRQLKTEGMQLAW